MSRTTDVAAQMLVAIVSLLTISGTACADDIVATVGSERITRQELEEHLHHDIAQLDRERSTILREQLDELIEATLYKLEAREQGITVEELEQRVLASAGEPKVEDIQKLYEQRMGITAHMNHEAFRHLTLDNLKPALAEEIKRRLERRGRKEFVREQRKKYGVIVAITPIIGGDDVVASIGPETITRAQLEESALVDLQRNDSRRSQTLQMGLKDLITERLYEQEARTRGTSVEGLKASLQSVGDGFDGFKSDTSFDGETFLATLRARYPVTVALKPFTFPVTEGGRPALGRTDAPVTIVEFSSDMCPFSRRAAEVIERLLRTYPDEVRFVHRDYPRGNVAAAHAAACAGDQGRFWEYRRELQGADFLRREGPRALAQKVGMDVKQFDECLARKLHASVIDNDIAEAKTLGVTGTPTFFINGRPLYGAHPFESFDAIIKEELRVRNEEREQGG